MAQSFFAYLEQSGDEAIRADRLGLLKQATNIIAAPSVKPKFMYFHLLCPHGPFVFDEQGEPVAYENMENVGDTKHYTGQLHFLSKKIAASFFLVLSQIWLWMFFLTQLHF